MNLRKRWPLLALPLLLAVTGCADQGLLKVTGRVTYKGEPVPSTIVSFMPEDGSRPSKGVTNDNGEFTLRYSRQQEGAYRGKYTVTLQYHVSNEEYNHEISAKASDDLKKVIAEYEDVKKSNLHFEVTKNGQFIEIKLE
jgi:hypothetical protein